MFSTFSKNANFFLLLIAMEWHGTQLNLNNNRKIEILCFNFDRNQTEIACRIFFIVYEHKTAHYVLILIDFTTKTSIRILSDVIY